MTSEPLSNTPVEELLRRAREGDRDACNGLLSWSQGVLGTYAEQRVSAGAPGGIRPSDVAQESAVKAWKLFQDPSGLKGDSQGELKALLRTVVESSFMDLMRRAGAEKRDEGRPLPLESSAAMNVPASQPSPSQVSAQRESFRTLLLHFSGLPETQHKALSLLHLERVPRREIEARLQLSEDALESLLRRAVRTLRARMDGSSEELEPEAAASHARTDAALSRYFRLRETDAPFELETFLAAHPDCAQELQGLLRWMEALRELEPSEE